MRRSFRTAVYSDILAWPRVFHCSAYEFAHVIAEVAGADLILPPPRYGQGIRDRITKDLLRGASKITGRMRPPYAASTELVGTYDLFVFIGTTIECVTELQALKGWRERAGLKIAYVIECWASSLQSNSRYVELLNDFDFVFLLHAATVPILQTALRAQCVFLPTAVDALAATPCPNRPARVIDICSIGRRSEPVHERLLELARTDDLFYLHDSVAVAEAPVYDLAQHRSVYFETIKRSQFFVCFDHQTAGGPKERQARSERVIPSRLFEGAACGAVIIGSAPRCPEFTEIFHWPDAVIELPTKAEEVPAFLRELRRQDDRLARVRARNVVECLRAHDWSHRWQTILETIGLEGSTHLHARQSMLDNAAAGVNVESLSGAERWPARDRVTTAVTGGLSKAARPRVRSR